MLNDLPRQLDLARSKERAARARVARLRRSLDGQNRRLLAQRKYVIGAAVIALADSGRAPGLIDAIRRWVSHYVSRDSDRAALAGTAFDVWGTEQTGAVPTAAGETT